MAGLDDDQRKKVSIGEASSLINKKQFEMKIKTLNVSNASLSSDEFSK